MVRTKSVVAAATVESKEVNLILAPERWKRLKPDWKRAAVIRESVDLADKE